MPGLAVSGRDFHSDKMTLHIFNPENDMAVGTPIIRPKLS